MVALCGTAASFMHLLLIRVGVAVGEAGCFPPANSLIADYFTRAERPRAVGIYTLGAPLSLVLGYFVAGWLNEFYGWRITFMLLGLPGVALAALAWLTLREPRRTTAPLPRAGQPRVKEVLVTLWANTTFRRLLICIAISNFFMYGLLQWLPAFFMRSYRMQSGEIGSWFAISFGAAALLGNYWGGTLATRYAANDEQRQLRAMALLYALNGLLSAGVYLAVNPYWAFLSLGLSGMALAATNGPLFATIQTLMPPQMRALSVAIVQLFANLIGLGLGPLAAGGLSDLLRPWLGEESLRYALLTLCPGFLLCVWYMWRASQTVTRDVVAQAH
jgi:MFS transporter, Spinster family, sphingosine-1-phosphate transporter